MTLAICYFYELEPIYKQFELIIVTKTTILMMMMMIIIMITMIAIKLVMMLSIASTADCLHR